MLSLSLKKLTCKNCQTLEHTVYGAVDNDCLEKNKLFKISNLYKEGQTLVNYNNPYIGLFCLHSGKLRAAYKNTFGGDELEKDFYPGAIVGMKDFSKSFFEFNLVALDDSVVCFYDKKYFLHLIESNVALRNEFLKRCVF